MGRPRTSEDNKTARMVAMIAEQPTTSQALKEATGVRPCDISHHLRQYRLDGRIVLQTSKSAHGQIMRHWVWAGVNPPAKKVEKKHKCLSCGTAPVPGGRTWVCGNCKKMEAWRHSSPYAIA